MIFIGPELSDPHAHFVTNIIACIGEGDDLVIDLYKVTSKKELYEQITEHLRIHDEHIVIYNAYEDEDFFIGFKSQFPGLQIITVFSDDEWRHGNYDRYLALYTDLFTIAVKGNIKVYKKYGIEPFYMPWACNPHMFYPLSGQSKTIDVSFIGTPYGPRLEYIQFLIDNGINLQVYGRGWGKYPGIKKNWGGFLSNEKMLEVVSGSKINLNFLWTSADKERCMIKARTLEISACRGFQLSNDSDEFANYGFVDGVNIAVFHDKQDFLEKIQYYLNHDDERESIRYKAYEHVLQHHTWEKRFHGVFGRLDNNGAATLKRQRNYRILVLVRQGVNHQITLDHQYLDIRIVDKNSRWADGVADMDGVMCLNHDSTVNNNSLYMMAFGLSSDQSDVIAANFYVGSENNRYWIRFRDILMERKRSLIHKLPVECLMFSGIFVAKYGCKLMSDTSEHRVSYIEYPSFWLKLSYYQSRKLRLYFCHHRNPRQLLKELILNKRFTNAFSLGVDKMWQKLLKSRLEDRIGAIKRKLRKWYDVYIKHDQKRITYYKYLDEGGELLRSDYRLTKEALVIDVGGYIGDFVAEMVRKFDCRVDVFEPVAEYSAKIRRRFSSNSKVRVVQAGFGVSEKHEFINVEGLGSSVFGGEGGAATKEKIRVISAVDYIMSQGYPMVDLMKINIEGGEYELLNSILDNHDLVKKIRYFQIQFHDFVPNAQKMRDEIRKKLSDTHKLMWDFPFIWESWEIKE